MHDLRFAIRTLLRQRAFTLPSIAVLSLAIGASTVMFSVVHAVLLRPLPYRAPEQLAMLWTEVPAQQLREGRTDYLSIEEWRRQSRTFEAMAILDPASAILTTAEGSERIGVARVSPNLLPILGVEPLLGRMFSEAEADERQSVALISYRFWQARFGGSPAAIGASLQIDGRTTRIVGVLPPVSRGAYVSEDVMEPHTLFADWEARRMQPGIASWLVLGRIRPGSRMADAQTEMTVIARRLDATQPRPQPRGISVVPLTDSVLGGRARATLWMLSGAVSCVLLIAIANVAGLSLTRGFARSHEVGIRAALGASPLRIARQLVVESLTLAGAAGLAGAALAVIGIRAIRTLELRALPRLDEVGVDARVLIWAVAISLLTGALVALAPVASVARRKARMLGDDAARGTSAGAGFHVVRRALVVAELALAIVLLAGAGLLVRSWWHAAHVDPGFRTDRMMSIQLSTSAIGDGPRGRFYADVVERVRAIPGVEHAAVIGDLFVGGNPEQPIRLEGEGGAALERVRLRRDEVSDRFFEAVGTPIRRGRAFTPADGPDAPLVVIVNEVLSRRLWPNRDPIGRRFRIGPAGPFTVVGIVGDMHRQGPEREPIAQMFEPVAQNPSRFATLLVRTSAPEPLSIVGHVRAAVREVEPGAVTYGPATLDARLGTYLAERRLQTWVVLGFSLAALIIAAVGIYGLIQYSTVTRTHEIGIRLAIGAQGGDIFRMIMREGLVLSGCGIALGLVGGLWAASAVSSLLFNVTATDPLTFAAVASLLVVVALAACYIPARRAMQVELTEALRVR